MKPPAGNASTGYGLDMLLSTRPIGLVKSFGYPFRAIRLVELQPFEGLWRLWKERLHAYHMRKHGFEMYQVFLSAPGDLARERDACRSGISDVNEREAMPSQILLVTVGLTNDGHIVDHRSAVAENVRASAYFIQIFEDDWGPKNLFRKMFHLAIECRDDGELPMREVVVFLKDAPGETDPEILAFRKELEERRDARVFSFDNAESLKQQVAEVSAEWVCAIRPAASAAGLTD